MTIDHVHVMVENGQLDESEIRYYVHLLQRQARGKKLKSLALTIGSDYIDMRYSFHAFPFDRIRRVSTAFTHTDKCG